MTNLLYEVLRGLLRGARTVSEHAAGHPHIDASIRLGPAAAPHAEAIQTRLADLLSDRADEVGIKRGVDARVDVDEILGETVLVSIDGEPGAVCAWPHGARDDETALSALVGEVDRLVRRRLSILLDVTERDRCAEQVRGVCGAADADLCRGVPEYLLDNGLSLARLEQLSGSPGFAEARSTPELAESIIGEIAPRTIPLRVPEAVLRATRESDVNLLVTSRQHIFTKKGVQFPDIDVRPQSDGPDQLIVRFNDVSISRGIDETLASWPAIVNSLQGLLTDHVAWFVRDEDVVEAREALRWVTPDLYRLSTENISSQMLSACLRAMLRSGESVRNLTRIMWLLIEPYVGGGETIRIAAVAGQLGWDIDGDADLLACHVRTLMAEEARQGGWSDARPNAVLLPPELEEAAMSEAAEARAEALWRIVFAARAISSGVRIATRSAEAAQPIRKALQALPDPPAVVAEQEMPLDIVVPTLTPDPI